MYKINITSVRSSIKSTSAAAEPERRDMQNKILESVKLKPTLQHYGFLTLNNKEYITL